MIEADWKQFKDRQRPRDGWAGFDNLGVGNNERKPPARETVWTTGRPKGGDVQGRREGEEKVSGPRVSQAERHSPAGSRKRGRNKTKNGGVVKE